MLIAYNGNGSIVGIWRGNRPLSFYMPDMSGKYSELLLPDNEAVYSEWYKYKVSGGELVLQDF